MANLIAVAFPRQETASEVLGTLRRLQTEKVIELDDAVAVIKDQNGSVRLVQGFDPSYRPVVGGALVGGLIGLIFLAPLLGMAIGTAYGMMENKFSDYGIDDHFMKEVSEQLQPGGSAIFALVRRAKPDKVVEELGQYGGKVLRTPLSRQAEENLEAAIDQQAAAHP